MLSRLVHKDDCARLDFSAIRGAFQKWDQGMFDVNIFQPALPCFLVSQLDNLALSLEIISGRTSILLLPLK